MEFSKDNIVSKHFSKQLLGGLNEFEVRDFLHALAEEIRHLTQKTSLQKKQIQEQEALIRDFRDREHILKKAIASAEKWAEKIRKDAEENSSLVLEKAHNKSESLIQAARQSLQTVYNDIADLKRLQLQFKTGLKAALQVQMDLLDQDPIFHPSSSLPVTEDKNVLEKKSAPGPSTKAEEKSSTLESQKEPPENPGTDELAELKKSLSALNKNFS